MVTHGASCCSCVHSCTAIYILRKTEMMMPHSHSMHGISMRAENAVTLRGPFSLPAQLERLLFAGTRVFKTS